MKELRIFLNSVNDAKILDVGTGNGNFVKIITGLSNDFQEIIGIDLLDRAIQESMNGFDDKRIKFQKMSALDMDFEDSYFDIVCLSNSLHHLENISESLKEMERVLKPGGYLLFSEMLQNNLSKSQYSHLLMHHLAAEIDRERGVFHDETFSETKIIEVLQQYSSLKVKKTWHVDYPNNEGVTGEELESIFGILDSLLKFVKQSEKYQYYKEKADGIKKYIAENGFDSATQLMVVLQ